MLVNIDSMINWEKFYSERLSTPLKHAAADKLSTNCPFHAEHDPSFWFRTTNGCFKCESCGESGNATIFLAKLEGISTKEAYAELCKIAGVDPKDTNKPAIKLPHTLAEYASAKALPVDFLKSLGLVDGIVYDMHCVKIPYYDADGSCVGIKQRFHPLNSMRFGWDKGNKPIPYGAWLKQVKEAKALILVEGESDSQSLWMHSFPALGIPGAGNLQPEWVQRYIGERDVYLHIEPGRSGETFLRKTGEALLAGGYKGKVHTFRCTDSDPLCKDPSDLHIKHGDDFEERMKALIKGAQDQPLSDFMRVLPAAETSKPKKTIKKLEVYRASELYDKVLERPPVIVDGLVPSGLTVLAGAPKRGKSWLALLLGICVAGGSPFLGHATTQGDALYLDLESRQYRVKDRLSKLIAGRAPESLYITHESDRLDGDLISQLKGWCDSMKHPVLIVIDTLGRVKGGSRRGENAYEGDTRILGDLQRFAMERKVAVVCVHHLRKSVGDTDFFERVSGSMGITGACDSVMVIQGKRGDEDSTLSVSSRDFEATELVMGFDKGLWTLKSCDSEAYKLEQGYLKSDVVRAIVRLANAAGRWEGSSRALLDELALIGTLPEGITPAKMSVELQPYVDLLCERDSVLVNWMRDHKGRKVVLKKVARDEF
ncbi:MAG: AAA family ATPase [Clostridia bacterium]